MSRQRWVIYSHPAAGHIRPTLPVVAELTRRGAEVVYYATAPFQDAVERAGAIYRGYGDHAWFERNLGRGGICGGMEGLLETSAALLPKLLDEEHPRPGTHIAFEAHALWAKLLVQAWGAPALGLCAMFAMSPRVLSAGELLRRLYGRADAAAARDGLRALARYHTQAIALRQRYGVHSPDLIGYLGTEAPLNLVFTARELQPAGAALGPGFEFVGADDAASEPFAWPRRDNRLRLLIVMGTMFNDAPEFYRACFAAFGGEPVDVLMAVGRRLAPGSLPPAPANFQVVAEVPQTAALRHADVFLTHGGINSAHEAMLAGVPMLVLPSQADHHIVAERVAAVGAGLCLERRAATPERLRQALSQVHETPSLRANAHRMGECLRAAGGARRAADLMETFAARSGA